MAQNDPILQSAQQIVESGTAPILGDDGKVVVQDIQQGGTFGQTITDDQGTYIEYFEPYEPSELELTEGVPLTGTAAMSAQLDTRKGEGIFVTKKVYMYPDREFANKYNSLDPEEREALIRSDEEFRKNTWNFSALNQYDQAGLTNQGQWELSLGGFDVDVATAREALENVTRKSYEKIAQADATLQQVAPEQYQRLSELEDELFELESIDDLAKDGWYYKTRKFELESEYKRILQTPIETEQGAIPFGNLDAWRQRLYSEQDQANIQNSFWQVYEGSDEHQRDQFYQEQVKRASDSLERWYENAGAAGYYTNLGLRKLGSFLGSAAANLTGLIAATPLLDLVGAPEARDAAEEMAIYLSIASRAFQGDVNIGSANRYEYALDDNRTAVVDAEGNLISVENINGFNLMRNMDSREIDRIQRQIIADRSKIYEDFSWGRLGSEVVDVGLYMVPILGGAAGIGKLTVSSVLKATGKEMLEKGTKMAIYQGASAASAFLNTLGQNYASAIEQGLNRENATKLALTQSAIEALAMSVVGSLEARTAMLISGTARNQAANAIRGYLTGYYTLDGALKRLGKVGIQVGRDVLSETVEEVGVEWGQGLAAVNYGLENHFSAQDVKNVMGTTVGLTLLMGFGLGTYRRQFRESRDAPTLDDMGQWRAQLVDKVMTNMDSVEKLAKTIGANAGLTPEQINQKLLQLRHAKQQYDALPSDMSLEERAEYISNVIEIETIKESLPNLNEDRILWEKHLSVLERRNRQILGLSPKSSPVSDDISKRAEKLGEDNEVSASAQDIQVPPPPIPPTPAQQPTVGEGVETQVQEDQYVSRDIGGETIFYRVGENGLLSIVNEVPEGASVLTQEEFDAQQGQESVQEDEIIEGEVPVAEEEPAVDQPSDLLIDRADDLAQPDATEQPTQVQEEVEPEPEQSEQQPAQTIPDRPTNGPEVTIELPTQGGVIGQSKATVKRTGNTLREVLSDGSTREIAPFRLRVWTPIYNEQVPENERIFDQEIPSQTAEAPISEQEGDTPSPSMSIVKAMSPQVQTLDAGFGDVAYGYTSKEGVEVTLRDDASEGSVNGIETVGDVELSFIGVDPENRYKGVASRELDKILEEVDKRDLSMSLTVDSEQATLMNVSTGERGESGLTNKQLKEWYASRGFLFDKDSFYGYRPSKSEDSSQFSANTYKAKRSELRSEEDIVEFFSDPDTMFDLLRRKSDAYEKGFYHDGGDSVYYFDGNELRLVDNVKAEYVLNEATKTLDFEIEFTDTPVEETTPTEQAQAEQPNTSSYVSNSGKELQVQQAEDGNWYRVKTDGSLYKNPITNQDYLSQIEANMSERADQSLEEASELEQKAVEETKKPPLLERLRKKAAELRQKEMMRAVNNVKAAFEKSNVNVKITAHRSVQDFNNYMRSIGQPEAQTNSLGQVIEPGRTLIYAKEGRSEIHVIGGEADAITVYHEAAHVAFFKRFGTSPSSALSLAENIAKALSQGTSAEKALSKKIKAFAQKYEKGGDSLVAEEYFAELVGVLSREGQTISLNGLTRLKSNLNKLFHKIIGVRPFTETSQISDVVDFLNGIVTGFNSGNSIEQMLDGKNSPMDTFSKSRRMPNTPKKGPSGVSRSRIIERVPLDPNLVKTTRPEDFAGIMSVTIAADRALAGIVLNMLGVSHEMKGGFLWPLIHGHLWACTNATVAGKITKKAAQSDGLLNVMLNANEGVLGSYAMYDYTLKTLNEAVRQGNISERNLMELVNEVTALAPIRNQHKEHVKFKSLKELENWFQIPEYTKGTNKNSSPYHPRRVFVESIFSKTRAEKIGVENIDWVLENFNDPLYEGIGTGMIIGAIEFDPSSVSYRSSSVGDADHHMSYPYIIEADVTALHLYDRAVDPRSILGDWTPKGTGSGVNTSPLRERELHPARKSVEQGIPLHRQTAPEPLSRSRIEDLSIRSQLIERENIGELETAIKEAAPQLLEEGVSAKQVFEAVRGDVPLSVIERIFEQETPSQAAEAPISEQEGADTASEDQTTALLSLAPLYSTKVTTEEQAKALINSEMFKTFVENVRNIAKQLGVEVVNINTGVGAFEGVGEVTSAWEVRGNFEDIVELAAIVGGLSPEVQDSTIASREIEEGHDDHNAYMYDFNVSGSTDMIIKALSEVGFDDSGYTLVGNKLYIYNVTEYPIEGLANKLDTLQTKIENNGGKIEGQQVAAVQSVYIDASNRKEIIRTADDGNARQQTDGESLHNARIRAMERTEAFLEWRKRINKPSQPSKSLKEYVKLRAKQLGLGMAGKTLSDAERARLKELESEFVVPLNKYFAVDESLYEAAKQEVEAIADEVATLVRDSFVSKFPIKKPARAAIKTVRWYSGQPNLLGDGSRTNIIVSNDADADAIFEELKRRYYVEGITRNEQETTELGYPKRLIEVLTPSGKIAEIQVMTPKGYLAKDGVKYFPKDQKSFARKILEQVREAVGFEVPDGVGHYFYEIDRDTNVPIDLRKRAVELSNTYYSLFTENPPNIDEARFKQDLQNFVNDVESADKSKWDDGNDGKTPIELSLYLNNIFDKQGNINYGKVEEISDGIEQGQGTIGELSLQEEKGRSEGGRTNVEASVILRGDRQANQAQYSGEPEAIAKRQEALLEQYAKDKGVWLDESEIEESSDKRLPSGQEASVWLNKDKATVTKAIDYSVYSENLEEFLNNRIALYNHLFPDTALQVVGFTKTDGKFKVVVSQPFIQGQMLAPEGQTKMPENEQQQLDKYMADTFGMERRGTTYFNSDHVIDDVHGGNVIKSGGKYYFIDVVPSLNEPADGLGGSRQYGVEPVVDEGQATPEVENVPESLSEIGRKSKQLKGQERVDALVEDAPSLLADNVTARQIFEAVDKKIPLNQIEDILAEAALTAEGQPKTATSNNISKVARALGIGTKSKIKEGGKVVNVIRDKNGNWKRVDKKGNIIDAPLTREQIAEANMNTSNLFKVSDIDMLIEHGLIEKKDC